MNIIYILSILFLLVTFLLYKKSDDEVSIVYWLVYSICLLFCYNILIVGIYSFIGINGSLFVLALFNYGIGSIIGGISFIRKKIQKYKFVKKELLSVILLGLVIFLIGFIRFRGFNSISYETVDPSTHYRTAIHFSRELEILNDVNSLDIAFGTFNGLMPASYINAGIMIKLLPNISSYRVFLIYDVFCFIMSALLFLVTINKVLSKNNKSYVYSFIIALIYSIGFPLNNLVFGFCYLGIGIMVVNLLYLFIYDVKDFNKNILYNLIVIFMLCFSLFFSYYLFMPCIYLAVGIYYISLWKKKKISFSRLFLYGVITLVIPFLIGFIHFMLPGFLGLNKQTIFTAINLKGTIYDNITPLILFLVITIVLVYRKVRFKEKFDYFNISLYILSLYIVLFIVLFVFKKSELYYFYKLFYLYWFFVIIFLGNILIKFKNYLYVLFGFIIIGIFVVLVNPDTLFGRYLTKINIFNWNARAFLEDRVIYNKEELEIMENSLLYKDICEYNNEFLIDGDFFKNQWFYDYTESIPVFDYLKPYRHCFYIKGVEFYYWEYELENRPCIIYFYENNKRSFDKDKFEVLFENNAGVILKRK